MPRTKAETAFPSTDPTKPAPVPNDLDLYLQAIDTGRQTLVYERSKAAAARVIFKILPSKLTRID